MNRVALLPALILAGLLGCAPKVPLTSDGRIGPAYQGPEEATFCSSSITYSDTVTASGTAIYVRREAWGNLSSGGLGSASTTATLHPATSHPIRQAEVRVTDPSGAVVQCGQTDNSGAFSVSLPRGSTTYTVAVNSRAYNNLVRASVLDAPERNQFYSLTASCTATGACALGTLTAGADGDLLGAAFNILDQIYNANLYLEAQVASCSFSGCRSVNTSNPLPKVSAYWQKGFNPNTYFGATSGLSFYLPGYFRLFILGGSNGDVNNSDTDHFDNSVIIHEYGHFLEDTVSKSDSPGGSHNGNRVIDPRLAWSEGWGNFFQAAVRNDNHYIDTIGNDDGQTDMAFYTDVESAGSTSGLNDYPDYQGEGNFREFSVTRLLWDAVDSNSDTQFSHSDNISGKFAEIWAAFTSSTHGFKASGAAFRNVGLIHLSQEYFQTYAGASDWSDLRSMERHDGDESQYGQSVDTSSCSGSPSYGGAYYYTLTPASVSGDSGLLSTSDQLRNNDFFHFRAPAGGSHTIKLVYKDANGLGQEADLDLYVYKDGYAFGYSADILGMSRADASGSTSTVENETVTAGFTSGADYMINVNVYTGNGPGTAVYYNILYDGSPLCPSN
jgi:hypothetical protein